MSSASAALRTSQNAKLKAASRCGSVNRSKLDRCSMRSITLESLFPALSSQAAFYSLTFF
jgi:hypothetical protein